MSGKRAERAIEILEEDFSEQALASWNTQRHRDILCLTRHVPALGMNIAQG